MGWKNLTQKLKADKTLQKKWGTRITFGVIGVSFLAAGVKWGPGLMAKKPSQAHASKSGKKSSAEESAPKKGVVEWFFSTYGKALADVQVKVEELRRADEENQRLRVENAHLRLLVEANRFECVEQRAKKSTHEFEMRLSDETRSRTGRTLASIPYKIPTELLPTQLYQLAQHYFDQRDDEKAAVIMNFLVSMEDDKTFKTPANFVRAGISWYRLENFELADFFFSKVLEFPDSPTTRKFSDQAKLWRAIVAERTGRHPQSQEWMRQVIETNPHSTEAGWVNRGLKAEEASAHRAPAKASGHSAKPEAKAEDQAKAKVEEEGEDEEEDHEDAHTASAESAEHESSASHDEHEVTRAPASRHH